MSEADVQLVRSWADQVALAEDPLDFWYENVWAEDVDHRAAEDAPDDHGPILGRDAMRAYTADWYEMWLDPTIAFENIIDAGPGCVIVAIHFAVKLADEMNYVARALSSGGLASADGPDRFVRNHHLPEMLRGKVRQAMLRLIANHLFGLSGLVLIEVFTDADDRTQLVV